MNLSDLLPYAEPYVPGCPEPMILDQLRAHAQMLCERSQFWRERLPKLAVRKGQEEYRLLTPHNARLVAVREVYWDDTAIPWRSIDEVRATRGAVTEAQQPDYWTQPEWGVIRIDPAPDADATGKIAVYAALSPDDAADTLPDELREFARGIGQGAAAALMVMPGKPWTDREAFQMYERSFYGAVGSATQRALRGMHNRSGRAAPAGFDPP